MRLVQILIFTLLVQSVFAFSSTVDSALNIFNDNSLADSTRIDALVVAMYEHPFSTTPEGNEKIIDYLKSFYKETNNDEVKLLLEIIEINNGASIDTQIIASNKFYSQYEKSASKYIRLGVISNLIENYTFKANYKKVDSLINKATQIIDHTIPSIYKANAFVTIGSYYRNNDKPIEAYRYTLKAIEHSVKCGSKVTLGKSYHLLADIFLRVYDYKKSEQYHNKSLRVFEKNNNILGVITIVFHQASEFFHSGEYQKCIEYLNKIDSADLYGFGNAELAVANLYATKLMCYAHLNEKAKYTSILNTLEKPHWLSISPIVAEKTQYSKIVMAYSNSNWLSVLDNYDYYAQNFSSFEYVPRNLKLLELVFDASKMVGNNDQSYIYLEKLYKMKEQIAIENKKATLLQLELKNEIIKDSLKQSEIKNLKRIEEEAAVTAKKRSNRIQYSLAVIVVLLIASTIAVLTRFQISIRLAQGLIFIFFILTFEFLLVVLDPWVEKASNGEVGYKILLNTIIALVLFGIHQASEKRLRNWILRIDK
ncbi:MAG: tetratricopeptide repeat protein [Bacteroidia bacterium]